MEELKQKEKSYEILLQHQINETRLLSERIALFFVANSVVFTGFILLVLEPKTCSSFIFLLGIVILGIVICFLSLAAMSASMAALQFWLQAQEQIEKEEDGYFAYMRQKEISPQIYGRKFWEKGRFSRLWSRFPYVVWVFLLMWVVALIYLLVWF